MASVAASEKDAFAARVRKVIALHGSANSLARDMGVSEAVVRKWAAAQSDPSRSHLLALARATNVRLEWLADGEGPMNAGADRLHGAAPPAIAGASLELRGFDMASPPDWLFALPADKTLTAADFEIALVMPRRWAEQETQTTPTRLIAVWASGDAMEPAVRDGDLLTVRLGPSKGEGPVVMAVGKNVLLRRLQVGTEGRIRATATNPGYEPFDLTPKHRVIGRVVAIARGFRHLGVDTGP